MPHQCTNCGRVFADGSKEMLSGCPNCGGNKFQFSPSKAGRDDAAETTGRREPSPSDAESADEASGSNTWRRAASRAADAEEERPDVDRETRTRTDRADGSDVDAARRRGQTLREWANSRGFASEVEDENDETTLRENRRRTGDAQRRPPERRSSTETTDSPRTPDATDSSPPSGAADSARTPDATDSPRAEDKTQPSPSSEGQTDPADRSTERPSEPTASTDRPTDRAEPDDDTEDDAQASARSEVVSPDEIRAASEGDRPTDADGRVIEPQSDDRPNLDELREELNEQFESIKIVAPGEYELNLMELYDRPEYIISLREDGRYVIEVPDTWGPRDDDDR